MRLLDAFPDYPADQATQRGLVELTRLALTLELLALGIQTRRRLDRGLDVHREFWRAREVIDRARTLD